MSITDVRAEYVTTILCSGVFIGGNPDPTKKDSEESFHI
jgi:hypothetical protein